MANNVKYELIIIQVNSIAKAMKNIYDNTDIPARETESIVKSAPATVTSYLSKDEANLVKEKLESDGSAIYSINEAFLTYRVVINDFDYVSQASQRSKVISAICNILGQRLDVAKAIAEKTPLVVKDKLPYNEAVKIRNEFLSALNGLCSDISVDPEL